MTQRWVRTGSAASDAVVDLALQRARPDATHKLGSSKPLTRQVIHTAQCSQMSVLGHLIFGHNFFQT